MSGYHNQKDDVVLTLVERQNVDIETVIKACALDLQEKDYELGNALSVQDFRAHIRNSWWVRYFGINLKFVRHEDNTIHVAHVSGKYGGENYWFAIVFRVKEKFSNTRIGYCIGRKVGKRLVIYGDDMVIEPELNTKSAQAIVRELRKLNIQDANQFFEIVRSRLSLFHVEPRLISDQCGDTVSSIVQVVNLDNEGFAFIFKKRPAQRAEIFLDRSSPDLLTGSSRPLALALSTQ